MSRHFTTRISSLMICISLLPGVTHAKQVAMDVSVAQPTLPSDVKQTTFLKIGLTGFELEAPEDRPAVNVALVLDKSGSMAGDKIKRAKEAAISALQRLNEKDIVSVITYDTNVSVIVPATKLSDRESIIEKVKQIEAQGSTALFAGVSKGAEELRKFLDKERVNRVILLSDGLANVGPQSPSELAELGTSLGKEGIAVSTIGLGLDYNEDLMTRLASASDGNHVFVEKSDELVDVFNREFQDVLSVVAQEVVIRINCAEQVRPVRVLNTEAEITGQDVYVKLNQLYSRQEKYVILEVEIPPRSNGAKMDLASVNVSYTNMETNHDDHLSSTVGVKFSNQVAKIEADTNVRVMELCVLQIANLDNQLATQLRDEGQVEEARQVLRRNADYLKINGAALSSELLKDRAAINLQQAELVDAPEDWKRGRKLMRALQYSDSTNQYVEPTPKVDQRR